jgi:hypothetical protein
MSSDTAAATGKSTEE